MFKKGDCRIVDGDYMLAYDPSCSPDRDPAYVKRDQVLLVIGPDPKEELYCLVLLSSPPRLASVSRIAIVTYSQSVSF